MGKSPDAVNLWIGNGRSTSALHKDNYENLYCMVAGIKRFVLISPVEVACVQERTLPSATYQPCNGPEHGQRQYKMVPDDPPTNVPFWPTIDPDDPEKTSLGIWRHCRPLRVELHPGDILYLPAMWLVPERFQLRGSDWIDLVSFCTGITKSLKSPVHRVSVLQ